MHMRLRTRSVVPAIWLASALMVSLSACGPEEETDGSGKSASSASTPKGDGSQGGGNGSSGSGSSSGSASSTGGSGGGTSDEAGAPQCEPSQLEFKFTPVDRPVNYVVLEAKNSGTSSCRMPKAHPSVTFSLDTGETATFTTNVGEASGERVTLSAGDSAYAGMMTARADAEESEIYEVTGVAVFLEEEGKGKEFAVDTMYIADPQLSAWFGDFQEALDAG
ncbi:DUF4232 domain-containing protein [Streptomyces sp. NPDC051776]|uniref:DUF4232 domain-containing protein n=1 Tax=Streptomyces sp. NPDC051776 TaxID=3155414 RepID=UPI00341EA5A0